MLEIIIFALGMVIGVFFGLHLRKAQENRCFELKDLTDEEIIELAEFRFEYDFRTLWSANLIEFARAILRKAQKC